MYFNQQIMILNLRKKLKLINKLVNLIHCKLKTIYGLMEQQMENLQLIAFNDFYFFNNFPLFSIKLFIFLLFLKTIFNIFYNDAFKEY